MIQEVSFCFSFKAANTIDVTVDRENFKLFADLSNINGTNQIGSGWEVNSI